MPLQKRYVAAFLLSQYAFLAADNFARYSGVSQSARLAWNSGEFMVAFSRSLRWASATGSDIFSRLLTCAARMPAIRFSLIFGSVLSILCCSRIGLSGWSNRCRLISRTSFRGRTTPSPPSVKLASVPPSEMRLKCAIKDRSKRQAPSQDTRTKRCTFIFSGPYFCTMRKHKEFRSFFLMQVGFHRPEVLPIPT